MDFVVYAGSQPGIVGQPGPSGAAPPGNEVLVDGAGTTDISTLGIPAGVNVLIEVWGGGGGGAGQTAFAFPPQGGGGGGAYAMILIPSGLFASGGSLVLAGILERQADELKQAYAPHARLEVSDSEDGWVLMTARL